MIGSFRQSMAWLHTWGGLVFGWLLAAIFVGGTLSVFAAPITDWMRAAPPPLSAEQRVQAVTFAIQHLEKQVPAPTQWNIYLPDDWLGWKDAKDAFQEAHYDPLKGGPRNASQARETGGGHHFIAFHYGLHAGLPGILLVGFVTMAMLVALVSGIVIHRRIFKDIFTLRWGKGQRAWLDGHNASSVLSLPFHLMIAYTGLAIFHYAWMPGAIAVHYGMSGGLQGQFDHVGPYFEARHAEEKTQGSFNLPLSAVPALVKQAQDKSGLAVEWLYHEVEKDGVARLKIGMTPGDTDPLPRPSPPVYLADGKTLIAENTQPAGSGEMGLGVMTTLHEARFGGWTIKWLWFLSGIVGCVMIATGLILFTVKRRATMSSAVIRLVDGLNIASISGITLASIAYLWGNRLLPLDLPSRAEAEIAAFFFVWLITLIHGLLRPTKAWTGQFGLAAILCLFLPVLNALTTGDWFWHQAARQDWTAFGVELTAMVLGLAFAALTWRLAKAKQ